MPRIFVFESITAREIYFQKSGVKRGAILGHRSDCEMRLSRSKIPPLWALRLSGGRELYSVDIYNRVRRACLKDGMSARAAAHIASPSDWQISWIWSLNGRSLQFHLWLTNLNQTGSSWRIDCCKPLGSFKLMAPWLRYASSLVELSFLTEDLMHFYDVTIRIVEKPLMPTFHSIAAPVWVRNALIV